MKKVLLVNTNGNITKDDVVVWKCNRHINPKLYKILRYGLGMIDDIIVIDTPVCNPNNKIYGTYTDDEFNALLEIYKKNIDLKPINQILKEDIIAV